jgi:hypothetical protein
MCVETVSGLVTRAIENSVDLIVQNNRAIRVLVGMPVILTPMLKSIFLL